MFFCQKNEEAGESNEMSCLEQQGITKRALFASMAIAAILALSVSVFFLAVNIRGAPLPMTLRLRRSIESTDGRHGSVQNLIQTENYNKSRNATICETSGCIRAATIMKNTMDQTNDPCDNFYEFACGQFLKNTRIPDDKKEMNVFSKLEDLVQDQVKTIISQPPKLDEPRTFQMVKNYYRACMNESIIEERGNKPLADLLEAHGGWPVVKGNLWSENSFDWVDMLKKFHFSGLRTDIIFSLTSDADFKNSTKSVLIIDQTDLGLEREFLIKGFDEKIVKSYHKFMIESAILLGADRKNAESELTESLTFEMKLANISLSNEERHNTSVLYNPMTIKNLQESYPYLNWLDFLNTKLPNGLNVNENEMIINQDRKFFDQLGDVLNSTSKRTIANYFMWRVVYAMSITQNEQFTNLKFQFEKDFYGYVKKAERWRRCISDTTASIPHGVSALYVQKYFSEESKNAAIEMTENIRKEFINILHNVTWLDNEARIKAIQKAETMTIHMGYPNELIDNHKLDELYKSLEIQSDDFLSNELNWNIYMSDHIFNRFRKPINKTDWIVHSESMNVNAYYSGSENSILFTAAILQDPVFSIDRPHYMNYAAIGKIVGHEITHGFDDTGREFDADGNLNDWWNPNTKSQFLEKTKCIIEQYGNYTDPKTNLTLNGLNTRDENIADNGGTKEAYKAYNEWVKRNGPEGILPGLEYNQHQLFWISVAQTFCSVSRPEYMKVEINTDEHSPKEFRVNGIISNMRDFARDFNCPAGTKMNPTQKCEVW